MESAQLEENETERTGMGEAETEDDQISTSDEDQVDSTQLEENETEKDGTEEVETEEDQTSPSDEDQIESETEEFMEEETEVEGEGDEDAGGIASRVAQRRHGRRQ